MVGRRQGHARQESRFVGRSRQRSHRSRDGVRRGSAAASSPVRRHGRVERQLPSSQGHPPGDLQHQRGGQARELEPQASSVQAARISPVHIRTAVKRGVRFGGRRVFEHTPQTDVRSIYRMGSCQSSLLLGGCHP